MTVDKCLIVEISSHVVGDRNDECTEVVSVTLEVVGGFEEFEFDHVAVHAVILSSRE